MSTNRRRRSRNKTSEYATVLAALADVWTHRADHPEPATRDAASEPVVSLAGYRTGRRSPQGPARGPDAQAV